MRAILRILPVFGLIFALGCASAGAPPAPVTIFAAASLKTALDQLLVPCSRAASAEVRASYAATSTLARQIEEGAPADIFISADVDWMDYVAARKLIQPATRVDLLGNRLVLVAPAATPVTLAIAPGFALAKALGDRRLALADPASVPAGKYAKAALTSLGVWDSVAGRVAPADNVRAALLLVSRGESPLGVVYVSDAVADRGVVVVDTFPAETHPPIVYPAAMTTRAGVAAREAMTCLNGGSAMEIFSKQGFTPIAAGSPAR